jgi:hypothetical protein
MNGSRPKRCRLSPIAESLEGRALLSVFHSGHHAMAPEGASVPPTIHLTLTGTSIATPSPTNPNTEGTDVYSLTGSSVRTGGVTVKGTDAYTSTLKNPSTYNSFYYFGDWTMTLGNGAEIAIDYQGTGPYPTNPSVTSAPYSQKITGEAIVISGPDTGKMYSVTGHAHGDGVSGAFTIKVDMKSH